MANNKKLNVANGSDRSWKTSSFVLWFGAYGSTHILVYADHLSDAFDEAMDWCMEHAPGLIIDPADVCAEGEDWEEATVDLSCGGNNGWYVPSWEWGVVMEEPTKAELLATYGR